MQLGRIQAVAVEGHEHRAIAEGAALVHAATARGGGDLALIGQLHLVADRQLQVVQPVESPRRQHADRRAGRQPFLDRQIGLVVVDHQAAHPVVGHDLVGDPGDIAPKAALLGLCQQHLWPHRNLVRAEPLAIGRGRGQHQRGGMGLDVGIDALIGAADEGVPCFQVWGWCAGSRRPSQSARRTGRYGLERKASLCLAS